LIDVAVPTADLTLAMHYALRGVLD